MTRIYCDICGRDGAERRMFFCDRRSDAAGSMENIYYDTDLCIAHSEEIVRKHGRLVKSISRSDRMNYGKNVEEWVEMQMEIWCKMDDAKRELAIEILELAAEV